MCLLHLPESAIKCNIFVMSRAYMILKRVAQLIQGLGYVLECEKYVYGCIWFISRANIFLKSKVPTTTMAPTHTGGTFSITFVSWVQSIFHHSYYPRSGLILQLICTYIFEAPSSEIFLSKYYIYFLFVTHPTNFANNCHLCNIVPLYNLSVAIQPLWTLAVFFSIS
jgi:hypothetical protein